MSPPNDLSEAAKIYIAESRPADDEHPSEEEWLAYRTGSLSEAEAERVQDHLIACKDCLDALRASELQSPAPGAPESSDFEVKIFQRLIQAKIAEEPTTPRAPAAATSRPLKLLPITLAASLVAAFLGAAGAWNVQSSEIERLLQPSLGAQIAVLDTAVYRSAAPTIRMRSDSESLTLELEWPSARSFRRYRITLLGLDGSQLWTSGILSEPPPSLVLRRPWIDQPRLEVVLSASDRGALEKLGTFPIEVNQG